MTDNVNAMAVQAMGAVNAMAILAAMQIMYASINTVTSIAATNEVLFGPDVPKKYKYPTTTPVLKTYKDALKSMGLTKTQLGKLTGINMTKLDPILSGNIEPTLDEATEIADALDIDITDIIPSYSMSGQSFNPDLYSLRAEEPFNNVDNNDEMLIEAIKKLLGELTPREQEIIKLRYGLSGYKSMTLKQVGKRFNVTQERIRQIEAKALRKLRHPTRSRKLKGFFVGDTGEDLGILKADKPTHIVIDVIQPYNEDAQPFSYNI